jgi:malate dehydrogenase (oxaloacetate-decarboxylating)
VQWEDFSTPHARPLLERYQNEQNELLTFNDDVQGTAAVVLGAVAGASKVAGKSMREHQIVFVGAGSAAIGVADYLRFAMIDEGLREKRLVPVSGLSIKMGCWTVTVVTCPMHRKLT